MELDHPPRGHRAISWAIAFALTGIAGIATPAFGAVENPKTTPADDNAAAPAAPQDAADHSKPASRAGTVDMATVVVTANKRAQRLQDVPMAVSAVSGDDLRRQGATSFADYATKVPGLNVISASAGKTQLVIRGITSGANQANATVSTYIDDAPYGSSTVYAAGSVLSPDLDPADLERVEVLRGPQGTLYGSNSLGGLIKFVTTPPDATRAYGRVSAGYESVSGGGSGFSERAMLNVPLIADKLAFRVNGYNRKDPGYIDNVATGKSEVNEDKVSGGRAQLLWTPTSKVSVRLSALGQNLSSDGLANTGIEVDPATLKPLYGYQKRSRAAGTGLLKIQYRLYDASVNADFGWASLISSSSYGQQKVNQTADVTTAYGPILNPAFGVANGGYSITQPIKLGKFTQELRLQSPEKQLFAWRVGGFYTREHTANSQTVNGFDATTGVTLAGLPPLGTISLGPATFKEWAGFGDVTWNPTAQLSVLVGARYTHDKTSFTQTGSGLLVGPIGFSSRSTESPTTYLVNPSFKFNDDMMAYVRVASGFRPGGSNVGVPPGLGAPVSFKADKLTSYELGFKSTSSDRKMTFDADVFYIDWTQIQLTSFAGGFSFLGNGGEARSRGAEAVWQFRPVKGLVVSANASYTDATLTKDTPPGLIGFSGDRLPWVPKWNGSTSVDYDFLAGDNWSVFVGGSYRYVGKRKSDFISIPGARVNVPSYHGIDLHAGTYLGEWTLRAYIKNVTNERGITSLASETTNPLGSPFGASYVPPRTVGVNVTVDF